LTTLWLFRSKPESLNLNRGNVDNSNLGDVDDMDVSFDCELSLSTNLEPNSFKEATFHDGWKKDMQKE
jgi:hypothetical protein